MSFDTKHSVHDQLYFYKHGIIKLLNEWRIIICSRKSKFLLKEFQFVTALKNLWSMTYIVCQTPIPMTS